MSLSLLLSEPYNAASRRGHRQPEALAAALAKRFFVENKPYFVTGCQRNAPNRDLKAVGGGSLWSWHWKPPKSSTPATAEGASNDDELDCQKTPQSMSERYRCMRSTLHERLTFGTGTTALLLILLDFGCSGLCCALNLTLNQRVKHMRRQRPSQREIGWMDGCSGKSSIHGWGVFTKQTHTAGDMV